MGFGWALRDETHSASVRTVHLSCDMKGDTLSPNWRQVAHLILEMEQSGRQILEKNICCRREAI